MSFYQQIENLQTPTLIPQFEQQWFASLQDYMRKGAQKHNPLF